MTGTYVAKIIGLEFNGLELDVVEYTDKIVAEKEPLVFPLVWRLDD